MRIDGKKGATMIPRTRNNGRNTLLAVFMAFIMPGLGQVYNGELIKGISFFIIILAVSATGIWAAMFLPDSLLIYGALATFLASAALYIAAIVDAFNCASRADASYQPKSYNRWYFYLALWLLSNIVGGSIRGYVTDHYVQAYKIPTGSMEPTVLPGDYVLADKTAYNRMAPKKGDIVTFVYPDDRSKKFIKRIEALPGDIITYADGTQREVPHGYAYMVGDNRENSYDSRQFGFVPLRDVIAKVRQVYFSSGKDGIRWNRIGTTINSS
jgi:signal peptidase I